MQMGQIFKSVGKLESLRRPTEWAVLGRTNAINSVEVVSVIHTCYRYAHPEAMATARRTRSTLRLGSQHQQSTQ
jgi:hypothetical protein